MSTSYNYLLNNLKKYTSAMFVKSYSELEVVVPQVIIAVKVTDMAVNSTLSGVTSASKGIVGGQRPNKNKPLNTTFPTHSIGVKSWHSVVPTSRYFWNRFVVISRCKEYYSIYKPRHLGQRFYSKNRQEVDNKRVTEEKKPILFFSLIFTFTLISVGAFVYASLHGYLQLILFAGLPGDSMGELYARPIWYLWLYLKQPNHFWNMFMGFYAIRWVHFCIMVFFFYYRKEDLLDDAHNVWLSHYVHKFRGRILLFIFLNKFTRFNNLKLLNQDLWKIWLLKTVLYFLPFLVNLIFIKDFVPHVFCMGILVMFVYQFMRLCCVLLILLFYTVGCHYDIFDDNYKNNYLQFLRVYLSWNTAFLSIIVVLFTFALLFYYDYLFYSLTFTRFMPTVVFLLLALFYNVTLFYACVRCLGFLIVKFFLLFGFDLNAHLDVHAKFLQNNYDFISLCLVILYIIYYNIK